MQATRGSEAANSRGVWGHAPPGKVCNFNVDFEASRTDFGSIGTSLTNDVAVQ